MAKPALAVFQDKLWIAFVAKDTNQLLVANSGNGQVWSDRIHVKNPNQSQLSKTAPALAVFQDKLWIAFVANSDTNQLLVSNSDNGQVWSDNILVKNPDQRQLSKAAPALSVHA
jgi:(2Fe-2S) ferredoxin